MTVCHLKSLKNIHRKPQTLFSANWIYQDQYRHSLFSPLQFSFDFSTALVLMKWEIKEIVGHRVGNENSLLRIIALGVLDPLLMIARLKWEPCPLHCMFIVHQIAENFSLSIFHRLYSSPKQPATSKRFCYSSSINFMFHWL